MEKRAAVQSRQSKPPKAIASSSKFADEYAKLNPDQRKAVETIEGPVMVVAGPGTGKTQVLAMRVANILKRTQMRPANILCLTFSVSGATAMRERLRRLIGADAYAVTVSTIHAFAQSIIEQQPQLFDAWSARKQLSDIEKIRQMNTIIDHVSSQSELINPKDPYGKVPELLNRISQVKREGKTHEELLKCADEYDAVMQGKSKAGTKAHEKNLRAARMFRDFTDIFRRYQEMLEATGHFDYDDSILYVIRALEEDDDLLASLQERYQYVLVDEFQDTNGAQYRLIELLTTYRTLPHEPNLFIVGDDDQAIYRFQGANLRNMLAFHERFPSAPIIPLTISYRSTQAILSTAQQLIERNDERLVGHIEGLQKILTAASGEKGTAPMLLRPASDTAEAWLIADLIEDRMKGGILPQEIAILTQTNQELFPVYDVLRARKIPVILRGKDDLLAHSLVLQALTILHAVEQPNHDSKLSAALGCACFGLSPVDLARLHGLCREKKIHFTDLLLKLPDEQELPLVNREALTKAHQLILDLQAKLPSRTALETVEHVLRDCGLVPEVSNPAESKLDPRDCAVIEAFFSFVKKQCLERPHCSLSDLLSELKLYGDPTYGQVRLTYELPHLTTEGVQLMTAHQSKGLEFDVVILTNFRDGHWDKRTRRSMVSIPEDIVFGWEKEQKSFEQHQDERRVAFVAMTRARRELLFTCPKEMTVGEKARTVSPSGFFSEMGELPEEDGVLRNPQHASLLLHPRSSPMDDALRGYIEERLKTFALSPTALGRFLSDPREFLLVDILMQPEHFDESSVRSLGYGSAVHWALRQWGVAKTEGKEFGADQFIGAFDWYLSERTILTKKQREDLLAFGKITLPDYFEQRLHASTAFLYAIEREYRARLSDSQIPSGIPLKGKIDRIDLPSATSALATVIDYKAGKPKGESEIRGGIEEGSVSRGQGGSHFRQLTFYALLLEHADPLLKPQSFVLDYIGERGEEPLQRAFTVSDSEKESLRILIGDVWQKIVNLDFTPIN